MALVGQGKPGISSLLPFWLGSMALWFGKRSIEITPKEKRMERALKQDRKLSPGKGKAGGAVARLGTLESDGGAA